MSRGQAVRRSPASRSADEQRLWERKRHWLEAVGCCYDEVQARVDQILADIRIRRNPATVTHDDGETTWTEYTADEAYTVRDLTEQEAIEQADSIWLDRLQASRTDSQRLSALETASLDQDEALAEIYQLLAGGGEA